MTEQSLEIWDTWYDSVRPTNTPVVEPTPVAGPVINSINGVSDGETVNSTVVIEAEVSDNNIAKVVFNLTGLQNKKHIEGVAPYFFLWIVVQMVCLTAGTQPRIRIGIN